LGVLTPVRGSRRPPLGVVDRHRLADGRPCSRRHLGARRDTLALSRQTLAGVLEAGRIQAEHGRTDRRGQVDICGFAWGRRSGGCFRVGSPVVSLGALTPPVPALGTRVLEQLHTPMR